MTSSNATSTLGLDMETLVELTPDDARQVNGGYASLSSALPPAGGGGAVSSALPPKPKHKPARHHGLSSVRPI
jgi:hypothetical protein